MVKSKLYFRAVLDYKIFLFALNSFSINHFYLFQGQKDVATNVELKNIYGGCGSLNCHDRK